MPLPACRHDDILTRFDEPSEWRRTLLDTIYRVPRSYEPTDLVSVQAAGFGGAHRVHASVVPDLRALRRGARAAGQGLGINSAHRTMGQQRQVFRSWEARVGYHEALEYAARPGHSEHHLGTAVDFSTGYRWLRRNAWRYGFVQTFPKGMQRETCFRHERWHYRYIGRAAAADVREDGVTLRRYLWEHHETAP
jgi:D-alanyl-D-alanine carboxypeptidase